MNILVTGAAGFIGSHIVDLLVGQGHEVFTLDDYSTGDISNISHDATIFTKDISEPIHEHFVDWALNHKIGAICHQAAQPSLLISIEDTIKDASVNIIGTINMLELSKTVGARFVMASTGAVYPDIGFEESRESLEPAPNRPYGISKLSAERYVEFYRQYHDLSTAVLRYGNVYGPRQVALGENQLIPRALDHIYESKPFKIYGDGFQTRDFIFVGDVARANLSALFSNDCGIFNISTGKSHSVNDILDVVRKNSLFVNSWESGEEKKNEPKNVLLPAWKAKQVLGWEAKVTLEEGIIETIAWYKEVNKLL